MRPQGTTGGKKNSPSDRIATLGTIIGAGSFWLRAGTPTVARGIVSRKANLGARGQRQLTAVQPYAGLSGQHD